MLTRLLQVALLLATDKLYGDIDGGCPKDWFGENCMYMCHCKYSADCDRHGHCANESSCMNPFFGPGCQYVDWSMTHGSDAEPKGLASPGIPCTPNSSLTSAFVSFKLPVTFNWFRIITLETEYLHNFSVKLNSVDVCYNERRFQLSDTELDVACDTAILLHKLELHGPMVQSICSVRISGGRNIAIKQQTSQSSNLFPDYVSMGESFRAVDGRPENSFDKNTCSHTKPELNGPWWFLRFNRPQLVFSVLIMGMQGNTTAALRGFILELLNEQGNVTEQYVDPNTYAPIYEVMLRSRELVRYLRIIRPPVFGLVDLSLYLCEVTAYGETICPDGKYGLHCSENCTCADDEICNLVNGLCAPGCDAGKYGFNCSMSCNDMCHEGQCRHRYGDCIQCIPGYIGEDCDKECAPGTYGLNCAETCSVHCVDVCQIQTGACSCGDHFSQPLCQDCAPGNYGENCTFKCPTTCEKEECQKDTGFCLSCQGGRMGRYCEECPNNYYGSLCYTRCSSFCINGTCDHHNGTCPACVSGYSGPQCVIAPESELNWGLLIILPLVAAVVMVCTILMLLKRPRHSEQEYSSTVSGESVSPETSAPRSPFDLAKQRKHTHLNKN